MPIIKLTKLLQGKDGPFDYSSVLVNLDSAKLVGIARALIDPDDLTQVEGYGNSVSDGLETDPHVTVLYGLLDNDPEVVSDLISQNWDRPVKIVFGKTMIFEIDDYDVVVVEIISDDLKALHELLESLPNEQTYDEYRPHMTLAYVKTGTGSKYDELELPVTGVEFSVDVVWFSDLEGKLTEISLIN